MPITRVLSPRPVCKCQKGTPAILQLDGCPGYSSRSFLRFGIPLSPPHSSKWKMPFRGCMGREDGITVLPNHLSLVQGGAMGNTPTINCLTPTVRFRDLF